MVDAVFQLPEPLPELVSATASWVFFLITHVAVWRVRGASRAGFGLMVGLWGAATVAVLAAVSVAGFTVHAPAVVALNGLWMALYLHLYTGMLRSVSLRVLGELRAGPRRRAELLAVYSPMTMLEDRLAWMEERGLIVAEDPRVAAADRIFTLAPAGRRLLAWRRPLVRMLVDGPTG
ncbi:MAG: hypothetical protein AAGM22_20850 [Acidobacteriota bacterium]